MKIVFIRHGEVAMKWEKRYTSRQFDQACRMYDQSPLVSQGVLSQNTNKKIYISKLKRTEDTAVQLFGRKGEVRTELFNEVPMRSFKDTTHALSQLIWKIVARIQWLYGSKRQPESRRQTVNRARRAISLVEENGEDCYVISHGFFLRVLIRELKKQGYQIEKEKTAGIKNLARITAVK